MRRFEFDVLFQVKGKDEGWARAILAAALERDMEDVEPVVLFSILDDAVEVDEHGNAVDPWESRIEVDGSEQDD